MRILVDSSIWIGYYGGRRTAAVDQFAMALNDDDIQVLTADLVIHEVTRVARSDKEFAAIAQEMGGFECVNLGGKSASLEAARLYRMLRQRGVTVTKLPDLFIANWCIHEDVPLLHEDSDFEVFKSYGLHVL